MNEQRGEEPGVVLWDVPSSERPETQWGVFRDWVRLAETSVLSALWSGGAVGPGSPRGCGRANWALPRPHVLTCVL